MERPLILSSPDPRSIDMIFTDPAKAVLHGFDLNTLPPGQSFTGLLGSRDLALDLILARRADFGLASNLFCKRGQVFEHS